MQAESCGGRIFLFFGATKGCQTETPVGNRDADDGSQTSVVLSIPRVSVY